MDDPAASGREGSETVRVGIHSGQQYDSFRMMLSLWREAEDLGYDWVSLFDHQRPVIFGPDGPCFDGLTALAALAGATQRVRCAVLVATVEWRHPALLATAAATIDHVSGGRLELGLGAGSEDLAFGQYGVPHHPLAERFERLAETCQILRELWSGRPVSFEGRHFVLRDAYLRPVPVQRRLPLVIGGGGVRKTLRVAAEHADVWNCIALPPERYRARVAALERHCMAVGRDPASIRRSITFRATIGGSTSRSAVPAADRPEFVSTGSAQECLDRLAQYAELGVRDFLLACRPEIDHRTVERFATDVAPALRGLAA